MGDRTNTVQGPRGRIVVLPLQPADGGAWDGTGLAVHFLLGNVLALHTGVEEFWFGWRVARLFPQPEALQAYCRTPAASLDLAAAARSEDVRYWLAGQVEPRGAGCTVSLRGFDALAGGALVAARLPLDPGDGLVGFRREFLGWLAAAGLPMSEPQAARVLWPEATDRAGMDRLGRALETFYCNDYRERRDAIELDGFARAVAAAPTSYLALDLHGWAAYRRQDYAAARASFAAALARNPDGAGAVSGLLWCAIFLDDEAGAYHWAAVKATLRGEPVESQQAAAAHRLGKRALERGDAQAARNYFRQAVAWAPGHRTYAQSLAEVRGDADPG